MEALENEMRFQTGSKIFDAIHRMRVRSPLQFQQNIFNKIMKIDKEKGKKLWVKIW